jgi:hypothetical protein
MVEHIASVVAVDAQDHVAWTFERVSGALVSDTCRTSGHPAGVAPQLQR